MRALRNLVAVFPISSPTVGPKVWLGQQPLKSSSTCSSPISQHTACPNKKTKNWSKTSLCLSLIRLFKRENGQQVCQSYKSPHPPNKSKVFSPVSGKATLPRFVQLTSTPSGHKTRIQSSRVLGLLCHKLLRQPHHCTVNQLPVSLFIFFYLFIYFFWIPKHSEDKAHTEMDKASSGITRSFRFTVPKLLIPLRPGLIMKQDILNWRIAHSKSAFRFHQGTIWSRPSGQCDTFMYF